MTRNRQRPEPLGEFSEWHRSDTGMPNWYKWLDIDYCGYIDPNRWPEYGYEPYVIIECIHIRDREKWGPNVNRKYPLHGHKQQFYEMLNRQLDVPVYVMWHPSECDQFIIREITEEETHTLSKQGFASLLDACRKKITNQQTAPVLSSSNNR